MNGPGHGVRCLVCVANAEVKDAVDFDLDVVLGDGELLVDVEDLLLEGMVVGDGVHEGDLEIETGLECATIAAESFDHELVALRHHHEWEESS